MTLHGTQFRLSIKRGPQFEIKVYLRDQIKIDNFTELTPVRIVQIIMNIDQFYDSMI